MTKQEEEKYPCPGCTSAGAMSIGQTVQGGKLRWYETVNCEICGLQTEADGIGRPPESIRKLLLSNEGRWVVRTADECAAAGIGLVLRRLLSLDLPMIAGALKSLPLITLCMTKTEAQWLTDALLAAGHSAKPELGHFTT
jgi:hypothetical protein